MLMHPGDIGPYESADRVWSGRWWPLYLVALFCVELHGIGVQEEAATRRQRMIEDLQLAFAETVEREEDVDEEIHDLFAALAAPE